MWLPFAADCASVLDKMDQIDPLKYGKTRNYLDGDVTYLSPYISRGVISTKQVLEHVLAREASIGGGQQSTIAGAGLFSNLPNNSKVFGLNAGSR